MIGRCIGHGLKTAIQEPALVTLLWCWNLAMGAAAALPAWLWLGSAFNRTPESDRLLTGFSIGILGEAGQYDRSPVRGIVLAGALGIVALAVLLNPLVSGGLLESLLKRDERPLLLRFFRGAGRFFWRYLRLIGFALLTGVVIFAIVAAPFAPISKRLLESAWEPAFFVGFAIHGGLLLGLAASFALALDYARIRTAIEDTPEMLRTWISSLYFVLRHFLGTFVLLAAMVAIFAIVVAVYSVFCRLVPSHTWILILLLILIQQAVHLVRAGLRVALVAGEVEYYRETGDAHLFCRVNQTIQVDLQTKNM